MDHVMNGKTRTPLRSSALPSRTGVQAQGPVAGRAPAVAGLLLVAACLWAPPAAQAQTRGYKVASDLQMALEAKQAPAQPWVRELNGQRIFRVLITGQARGSDLAAAREAIVRRGGSVLSYSAATSTIVAVLPAAQVRPVAERADVMHIAPDRVVIVAGLQPGQGAQSISMPGFAPSMASARGRNDLALLGE